MAWGVISDPLKWGVCFRLFPLCTRIEGHEQKDIERIDLPPVYNPLNNCVSAELLTVAWVGCCNH